ncbi:MAG: DEAD/DEAH box helicase [Syntrophobacteraceae bacterium]|nr:DEAD/DEAH box helicase [Syntrophobacteraceae bacterium]
MSFKSLGLSAELLRAIADQGYSKPTPIQRQAIPVILERKDVLGGAQTGTGKTAGFALPLLQLLSKSSGSKVKNSIRALILTPTRELAAQVEESVAAYGKYLPLKSAVIFGGVKINPQIEKLRRGVDILVATPGRLLDHVQQRTLDLSQVEILVLDEADRMLDMGFIHDIRRILTLLPRRRQNLLFFATFSNDIERLAENLLNSPVLIEAASRNSASETIEQLVHPVDRTRKRELLTFLIGSNNWRKVLVFTRTKHGANKLTKQLEHDGISAAAIHGNKSQATRTRTLAGFKKGEVRVLVATDIAARGLDIEHLPHVVNFELPGVSEDYVHRIGRTGRAECEGIAISLVCIDERDQLREIERVLKREIPKEVIEGYEPDPSIKAEPIPHGRNNSNQRRGGDAAHGNSRNDVNSARHATRREYGARKERPQGGSEEAVARRAQNIPRKQSVKGQWSPGGRAMSKGERPSDR